MDAKVQIPSLTGLRFYAAALIAYNHGVAFYIQPVAPLALLDSLQVSRLGMTLFFVLSGFVIQYNYGAALATFRLANLWSFVVARFARLYPLYLLVFLMYLALRPDYRGAIGPFLASFLTMTQDWWPVVLDGQTSWDAYVGSAWSISAEVAIYVIYLPCAPLLARLRSARWATSAVVLFMVAATMAFYGHAFFGWLPSSRLPTDGGYNFFYHSPATRFFEFLLGALVAILYGCRAQRRTRACERTPLLIGGLVWIVALCLLNSLSQWGGNFDVFEYCWGFAPACAGLIYYFARNPGTVIAKLVESRPIVLLGDASYSLYLLGYFGLTAFVGGGRSVDLGVAAWRMMMAWLFLGMLSVGVHRCFEVPARRAIRTVLTPPQPSTRVLAAST